MLIFLFIYFQVSNDMEPLQDFFNEMHAELGISLENIVYYKDETHYFVMSTKKQSLLHKKVLKKVREMCHQIYNSLKKRRGRVTM